MSKKGRVSLLFGVAAGALTGLLFAPTKGKDLRKKIAQEREEGGVGHKSIAKELSKMAEDISKMTQEVAKSEEAKHFWQKTTGAVSDWTEGNVDIDDWVKTAHKKADQIKAAATKYGNEKKKYIKKAKGTAKKTVKKAKATAKTVKSRAKAVKKAATGKTTTKRKPAAKKKTTTKRKTTKKK